jgi:hypothetical protein
MSPSDFEDEDEYFVPKSRNNTFSDELEDE